MENGIGAATEQISGVECELIRMWHSVRLSAVKSKPSVVTGSQFIIAANVIGVILYVIGVF